MPLDSGIPEVVNDAFISYSRRDKAFAVAIGNALQRYRPPRDLRVPQRHLVVFRDESDFTGVEYHQALTTHLGRSAKLVVLCSPSARQSEFVNDEIRQFTSLRGAANVVPVLVSGVPNNEAKPEQEKDKAFPEALVQAMEMPLASDYLGFDSRRDKVDKGGFAGSWYKLLADIYGVSRSELEQRDKKREARRRRVTASVTGAVILALSGALVFALPANSRRSRRCPASRPRTCWTAAPCSRWRRRAGVRVLRSTARCARRSGCCLSCCSNMPATSRSKPWR
jgi:hypothetical protein